ncbi:MULTISPECIES: pyridoxal phosphate-dependent aminotransferase [unclassified Kitasatospora]|uniref:pyridoxal phosphate-dependent aminotransferase n=1 Tax=unclassified Kitasatospora TaxID=2633591 RepID=UPI0036AD8CBA
MKPHARRLDGFRQSTIRAMTERCVAVGGINLGQGLSRTPPPDDLLDHATAHFASADHSYSPAHGDAVLRQAVARKLAEYNGVHVDPEHGVVATIGATGAYNAAVLAHLDPGDGLLLPEPFYGYHRTVAEIHGVVPQPVRTDAPGFRIDRAALEAATTDRTRAIVLCTPGNPSGHRMPPDEIEEVARFAADRDLLVITDEIYEHLYYGDEPHRSPASFDLLRDRTITVSGLSKTYSIPGWRLGYAAGPPELIAPLRIAADALSVCAPTPLQQIAARAFTLPDSFYARTRQDYRRKRDRIAAAFRDAGLATNDPEGAYYLLVDGTPLGGDSGEVAETILSAAGIATIPADAFHLGPAPYPYVRACFALTDADILRVEEHLSEVKWP